MKKPRTIASMILLSLHNIQLLLWSALLVFQPDRIFQESFNTFAARSWTSLKQTDDELVRYVGYYARFWGIQGLLLGIIMTFICFTAYRRHQKWSWIAILLCSTIGWGSAIALDLLLKDTMIVLFDTVPLLLVYASLAVSTKDVFLKDTGNQKEL